MKKICIALSFVALGTVAGFSQTERIKASFEQGDLVVSNTGRVSDGELNRSGEPYSDFLVGVFNEKTATRNLPSIIESGIAYIKFDTDSGHVLKGDYITSSSKPGYGMKANRSGMVIGVAMSDSHRMRGLLQIRVQVSWVRQ